MSALALADLLGVSRQVVSQYEKGLKTPSPEIMWKIVEILKLPAQFFTQNLPQRQAGTLFYRSMSSATKSARARAERRYEWLQRIVAFVSRAIKFPKVDFPDLDMPVDPAGITEVDVETAATATRRFWKLGDGPISNIAWLLENNGAVVARFDLGAEKLDAFSEWSKEDITPYIILGGDKCAAARSRFDASHELGHMILHRALDGSLLNQKGSFRLLEDQANRFASAFLLPAASFSREFIPTLACLQTLKTKWRVSIAAMIMRAGQLQLISSEQERRLWINLSRRGWRLQEPLDDLLEPEQPRFLRRSVEALLSRGMTTPQELEAQLALHIQDIENLIAVRRGFLSEWPHDPPIIKMPQSQMAIRNMSGSGSVLKFGVQRHQEEDDAAEHE